MLTLRVVRFGRRLVRRLFGKNIPHWLKDSTSLFKYINVFRLAPTLQVLFCAPNHFFKSIPAILAGKKTYYVSPLQFLSNVAIAQLAILTLLYGQDDLVDKTLVIASNLALVLLTPVLMIAACVALIVVWFISSSIWPLNHLAKEVEFNFHALLIPLSLDTYRALAWGRYIWSLFYCYLYFYVLLGVLSLTLFGGDAFLVGAYAAIGNGIIHINKLTIIPFGIAGLLIFFAGYWLVVRPYIQLLLHCVTRLTHRIARYLLRERSSAFL